MERVVVAWSGGKDSCQAMYLAKQSGFEIAYLANTVSQEYHRVRFHGVEDKVIQLQAEALGIPLLQMPTSGNKYTDEFKQNISNAEDIQGIVFGDIHLQHCLDWANDIGKDLNLEVIEPLWGNNPITILKNFVDSGFEAIVVSTQAKILGKEWIGRKLDRSFWEDIQKQEGIDVCGENGEYHTLVMDGPLFKKRLDISKSQPVLRDGYWFLDIQEYGLI